MHFLDAIKLALQQIRVQKLKSFFTLLGVMIGVMFLVAVITIVQGMGRYMEEDFVGKLMGVNTFELRRFPSINIGNVTDAEWKEWTRRPYIARCRHPSGGRWPARRHQVGGAEHAVAAVHGVAVRAAAAGAALRRRRAISSPSSASTSPRDA